MAKQQNDEIDLTYWLSKGMRIKNRMLNRAKTQTIKKQANIIRKSKNPKK